jgi:chemotaxis protein MotB
VLERIQTKSKKHRNEASTKEKGVQGEQTEVTQLRDGLQFVVGTPVLFEPDSARLSPGAKGRLDRIAELVRGYNNVIQIRGHAAALELTGDGDNGGRGFDSLWQLSHARARAVLDYLSSDAVGLRPGRFRLVAAADREPRAERAYESQANAPNRRVEVVVAEQLTAEVKGSGDDRR